MGAARSNVHLQMLAAAERAHVPLSAVVELTHACNLDCEMCYLDLKSDRAIGALSSDEWKSVFDQLARAGCLVLTLTGGELTSRSDWLDLARHARRLGFALRLYTNATLIDDALADEMKGLHPLAVEVSLHAASAEVHDEITRKKGSFVRALRGVEMLRVRGLKVVLKCVVGRRNAREVDALRALADRLGASIVFDAEITPKNDGNTTPTMLRVSDDELMEVAKKIWGTGDGCAHHELDEIGARRADAPCSAGRRTVHIGPTGDVFPCTQWPQPMGNLRRTTFEEIWRDAPTLQHLRTLRIGDLACGSCELVQACNPCMALSLLERGNLDGPSNTKCHTAPARAALVGVSGRPLVAPSTNLVQLRVPSRAARG